MRCAAPITSLIGDGGSNIISRVMGRILASVAATRVLDGIKLYFA
jgi:multiple antibiotic resistance protein